MARKRSRILIGWVVLGASAACAPLDEAVGGSPAPTAPFDSEPPADGWRWESSLGVQLAVPDDWKINDTDCLQTDAPSVVRAQGAVQDCFTPEPTTKQIVEIMSDSSFEAAARPSGLRFEDITIGDEPAERGEGTMPDGRAAGWLHIPDIGVIVDARVKDTATLHQVFESVRVVEFDHNACAVSREQLGALAPAADSLVPRDTHAVSVCLYAGGNVLQASALIEGSEAEELASALRAAAPGRNADVPANQCLRERDVPPPDVVLIAHGSEDRAQVEVTFSTCSHRGMSNGRSDAQVTSGLVQAIMAPLHVGYSHSQLPD